MCLGCYNASFEGFVSLWWFVVFWVGVLGRSLRDFWGFCGLGRFGVFGFGCIWLRLVLSWNFAMFGFGIIRSLCGFLFCKVVCGVYVVVFAVVFVYSWGFAVSWWFVGFAVF